MTTRKTLTIAVSCKHCGATVMIEKQSVPENENSMGGVATRMCPKCHKTSNYIYEIRNGQFVDLR